MSNKPRYLTKSRFKVGYECANKLFFLGKPEFRSNKNENAFLTALADGGFQVGEIAKVYLPDGIEVETIDIKEAIERTKELLKKDRVTIFEAAISFGPFLIRIDILE